MSRFIILLTVLIGFFFLTACNRFSGPIQVKLTGETQGTYYAVTYYAADSLDIQPQIDSLLKRLDSSVSLYKPNSIISRLNAGDTSVMADSLYTYLFNRSMEISEATNGLFDITVGPLVNAWGFGVKERRGANLAVVDSIRPFIGYQKVKLVNGKLIKEDPRMEVNMNGIAQGFAVDLVADFLSKKGLTSYLVDIGGEVFARGTKPDGTPWKIAIERPSYEAGLERTAYTTITLKDMALSTSGSYREFYEDNGIRYSHTIDPVDGFPVNHSTLSVSVLAPDCMTADAYATALMVMGLDIAKEYLKDHPEVEAYLIYAEIDGNLQTFYTHGFYSLIPGDEE